MQERTPAQLTADATGSIRALNHALRGHALREPADVYDTLGELAELAALLSPAIAALARYVDGEVEAGRVQAVPGFDFAGDPVAAAVTIHHRADQARHYLHQALDELARAHSATAGLASTTPPGVA